MKKFDAQYCSIKTTEKHGLEPQDAVALQDPQTVPTKRMETSLGEKEVLQPPQACMIYPHLYMNIGSICIGYGLRGTG